MRLRRMMIITCSEVHASNEPSKPSTNCSRTAHPRLGSQYFNTLFWCREVRSRLQFATLSRHQRVRPISFVYLKAVLPSRRRGRYLHVFGRPSSYPFVPSICAGRSVPDFGPLQANDFMIRPAADVFRFPISRRLRDE